MINRLTGHGRCSDTSKLPDYTIAYTIDRQVIEIILGVFRARARAKAKEIPVRILYGSKDCLR